MAKLGQGIEQRFTIAYNDNSTCERCSRNHRCMLFNVDDKIYPVCARCVDMTIRGVYGGITERPANVCTGIIAGKEGVVHTTDTYYRHKIDRITAAHVEEILTIEDKYRAEIAALNERLNVSERGLHERKIDLEKEFAADLQCERNRLQELHEHELAHLQKTHGDQVHELQCRVADLERQLRGALTGEPVRPQVVCDNGWDDD